MSSLECYFWNQKVVEYEILRLTVSICNKNSTDFNVLFYFILFYLNLYSLNWCYFFGKSLSTIPKTIQCCLRLEFLFLLGFLQVPLLSPPTNTNKDYFLRLLTYWGEQDEHHQWLLLNLLKLVIPQLDLCSAHSRLIKRYSQNFTCICI